MVSHNTKEPDSVYYKPRGEEVEIFSRAWKQKLPVLIKGPTGAGKSRFVEFMAFKLGLPLIQVACNEDTSASDLLGRFLLRGNETVWEDGPVTRAVRQGCLLYLDEIAEARPDVVVVLHSLTDHRRSLYLDKINEVVAAPDSFLLVASYNPGYQSGLKELKPSTKQRFIGLSFYYPSAEEEAEIILHESGISSDMARKIARLGQKIRNASELVLRETVSTRLLVYAAKLMEAGLQPRESATTAIAEILTDDAETLAALKDMIALSF